MTESWTISPLIGVGPLKLGMSRAAVDALSESLGPIDEPVSEETRPDGRTLLVEYRDKDLPECVFDGDALCEIVLSEFVRFDIQLDGTSIFTAPPQDALAALVRACGPAYWKIGRLFFPAAAIQVIGIVADIGDGGTPVFHSAETGYTTPTLILATSGSYDAHIDDGLQLDLMKA